MICLFVSSSLVFVSFSLSTVDLSALYISRYVPSDPNKVINLSSDFKSSFSITSHSTTSEGTGILLLIPYHTSLYHIISYHTTRLTFLLAARCLHNLPVLSVYKWHEHKAYLMLSMHRGTHVCMVLYCHVFGSNSLPHPV